MYAKWRVRSEEAISSISFLLTNVSFFGSSLSLRIKYMR